MKSLELNVNSEFGKLRKVIVQNPAEIDFLPLEEAPEAMSSYLQEKSSHPEDDHFNIPLLREQLTDFHHVLKENGVELLYVRNVPEARYQLFTRDLGFVVGDALYMSRMRYAARSIEHKGLRDIKGLATKKIKEGTIEGGDVLVQGNSVYVGLSARTNLEGFESFKEMLASKGYSCIPVFCKENVLHLDCRFNIISPKTALVYGTDILPEGRENIEKHFKGDVVDGPASEVDTLGSNFFIINPGLAVVEKRNLGTREIMRQQGYQVISLDFSEVNKLWGSFRCTTLPIYRE